MFKLRDYQIELSNLACKKLKELGVVYLNMEVRTGKSLIALQCAKLYGAKRVLFLTKLKAIPSVKGDYDKLDPGYELVVINDESMHKVDGEFDLVIHDEHHRFSSFPRPGKYTKMFKERFSSHAQIWLSGTASPESWSQLYHQFWVSNNSPFKHKNFYSFARDFVDVRQRVLPQGVINDYSRGVGEKILPVIEPYMIRLTQKEAGFVSTIHEKFCYVPMPAVCKRICDRLMETGVVAGKTGTISAENAAALLQKVHQVCSGTIILDEEPDGSRKSIIISDAKAQYIAKTWPTEKLVIFYTFKAELTLIKNVLGDRVTTDVLTFQEDSP
jgi:molybdopterin/thiamine biosynthesis adenylyltransferase